MPNSCVCCGHIKGKGDQISMFHVPAEKKRRQQWLGVLQLSANDVNEHTRVCSRHFLHGNPSNIPALDLGKRFASPKKVNLDRSKRAMKRARHSFETPSMTSSSSRASSVSAPTPGSTTDEELGHSSFGVRAMSSTCTMDDEPMSASIGEPLLSNYSVHELPSHGENKESDIAFAARVEYLEAKTKYLRNDLDTQKAPLLFRIEQIA